MKRRMLLLSFGLLLVGVPVATGSPSSQSGTLAAAREAMSTAAELVGPPPADLAEYWADKPYSFAHPDPEPRYKVQPNGRGFLARVVPYELGGGLETVAGDAVVQGKDGWWRYAIRGSDGRAKATARIVLRDAAPPAGAQRPRVIWTTEKELPAMRERLHEYLSVRHRTMTTAAAQAGTPVVFKVPALLFEVNQEPFEADSTPAKFEALLSGTGTSRTGTVTEMYLEQSFGNMVIDFDVYGTYESVLSTASNCWYGTDGGPILGEALGLGGYGSRGMAAEAVPQADPSVDFGQYDNDLDGNVDFLLMIHSGAGAEATGDPCDVHSHYFPGLGEPIATSDLNAEGEPVLVGPAMTVPEIDSAIGVTAHELMHALGEPDYYDTSGVTQGTGDWDLGAGGSWSGIPAQTNPIHFNPVMKINMGWVEPKIVSATALNQALRPRASYPDLLMVPLRIAKAGTDEADLCDAAPIGLPSQNNAFYTPEGDCLVEGFLVENLSRVSAFSDAKSCKFLPADFDRQAYGSGLAVWHWDFRSYQQGGNNDPLRYMLDLEEFDRRDEAQELQRGVTRADPLDLFWGDPVGISGATQVDPAEQVDIPPPAGSPWTVTGAPGAGAAGTEATPIPEWQAAATPPGTGMQVTLSWEIEDDDWDLYIDRWDGGSWVEVGKSAGGAPQTQERFTVIDFETGDRFRVRAYNWLGPSSPQADVTVRYTAAARTQLGPAGTRDNDGGQTGWAFTNLRPNDYVGFAHAAEQPGTAITLDLVKHGPTTVDVSGDFLRPVQETPAPIIAGQTITLRTLVYNHGGKAANATVQLKKGGATLVTRKVALGPYARQTVDFPYKAQSGLNTLWAVARANGDVTPGNDSVRTDFAAYPQGADVLIVDNDRNMTQEEGFEALLQGLGVSYHVVQGEPSADTLRAYKAAIWLTTSVSGGKGVISADAISALTSYLDDGGRVWFSSSRAMGYLGAVLGQEDFLARYFGLAATSNLLNSTGVVIGLGDAIGGSHAIEVGYLDGRPYLDYGVLASPGEVAGTATALFRHEAKDDNIVGAKVVGTSGFRTAYTFPLQIVKEPPDRARLGREVLSFLGVPLGTTAAPSQPSVKHERFRHVQVGEEWPVVVGAVAKAGVKTVDFVYRPYGGSAWKTLRLTAAGDGLFGGTIPAADVANNGLEYFARVITKSGQKVETARGAKLPEVASAPYGDPAPIPYGNCG